MKGATGILGSMNRSMNLPALQRIAMEFEKENDIMDQRQEMMDDAIDDATMEDEGAEDEVVDQVLEEIGIDLRAAVSPPFHPFILIRTDQDIDGRNALRNPRYRSSRIQATTSRWYRRSRSWRR